MTLVGANAPGCTLGCTPAPRRRCIQTTSAVTYQVSSQVKNAAIIFAGFVLFAYPIYAKVSVPLRHPPIAQALETARENQSRLRVDGRVCD